MHVSEQVFSLTLFMKLSSDPGWPILDLLEAGIILRSTEYIFHVSGFTKQTLDEEHDSMF